MLSFAPISEKTILRYCSSVLNYSSKPWTMVGFWRIFSFSFSLPRPKTNIPDFWGWASNFNSFNISSITSPFFFSSTSLLQTLWRSSTKNSYTIYFCNNHFLVFLRLRTDLLLQLGRSMSPAQLSFWFSPPWSEGSLFINIMLCFGKVKKIMSKYEPVQQFVLDYVQFRTGLGCVRFLTWVLDVQDTCLHCLNNLQSTWLS